MNLPYHLLGMSRRETLLSVESGEEISTTLTSNMESNMHPQILVWNRKFLFEHGHFRPPSRFKNAWSYGLENVFGTQVLCVTSWWFCWVWNCFVSTSWLLTFLRLTFSQVNGSFLRCWCESWSLQSPLSGWLNWLKTYGCVSIHEWL